MSKRSSRIFSVFLVLVLFIIPMTAQADHDPVILHGTVFRDEDGGGTLDAGETGLPDVTVSLFESDGTTLITSMPTGSDGSYEFTTLDPGDYIVEVETLVGYADTTPTTVPFSVDGSTNLAIVDFGKEPLPIGSISGTVFDDISRDGVYDSGTDIPLAGVFVTLFDPQGGSSEVETNASGEYEFIDLPPGAYTVVETDPETFYSTTPNTVPVELPTLDSMDVIVDFGDFVPEEGEVHRIDLLLMKFFDISLLEFQALREMEGWGYGNIAKAYFIAQLSDTALVDILGMRETMGWGNIMKEILGYAGLKGYNLGLIVSGREVPNAVSKLIEHCEGLSTPEEVQELYALGANNGSIRKACRLANDFETLVEVVDLLKTHNFKQVAEMMAQGLTDQVTNGNQGNHGPPPCKGKNKYDDGCNN